MDDKPISELIVSGDPKMVSETPAPKKQNKPFIIVVSILLFLIACVAGYYVYTQYFANEEEEVEREEEEEEKAKEPDDIEVVLSDGSEVYIKIENSGCDDTGFAKVQDSDYSIWEDNQNSFCSSSYIIGYFPTKDIMSKYYASSTEVPTLQKSTINGIEYEFISKVDGITDQGSWGMGLAYKWEPEITVKEYKASSIISYYNPSEESSELSETSLFTSYCLFDLSKLFEGAEGYLVFSGVGDVYSDVDYCSSLNEMETFSITK